MALSAVSLALTGLHRLLSLPLRLVLHGLGRLRVGRGAAVRLSLAPGRQGDSQHARLRTLEALETLGADPLVAEVILDLRGMAMGWSGVQDLQQAVRGLAQTDTRVTAHVDGASLRELALLAELDHVALTPSAELLLTGLGSRLSFYADAFALLGIEMQMESAGRFKSFGEAYVRRFPSEENRSQLGALLGDLWDQLREGVDRARPEAAGALAALLGQAPQTATSVAEAGLVDALAYPDQLEELRAAAHGGELRTLSHGRYAWSRGWARALGQRRLGGPVVAVVHLEGPVVERDEGQRGGSIAAADVVPVLDSLADQPGVRAVVLSVQSPGGSALASDLIARAVRKLGEKKPVVAVFGDVSASGGYYLAAPAAEIVARPGTITGSIGVVGGKPVLEEALRRIGVHQELVSVGPDVGMFGPFAGFSADQRRRYQASIARTYDRFLDVVSAGRRMPREAVHAVAQGRVWTGRQAKAHGLVDHLGDLRTGLARARALAGVDPGAGRAVHLRFTPPRWRSVVRSLIGASVAAELPAAALPGALVDAAGALLPGLATLLPLLPALRRSPHLPLALLPLGELTD